MRRFIVMRSGRRLRTKPPPPIAGKEDPIIILGHSLGADAVMEMSAYLPKRRSARSRSAVRRHEPNSRHDGRGLFAPPPWSPGKWPDQLLSIFCSTLRKSRPRLMLSTGEFDRTWSHTVGREMIRRLDLNPLEGSRQIEMDHTPIAAGRGPVACADSGRHGGIGSAAPNRVGRLRVLSGFPDDRARRATARGRA